MSTSNDSSPNQLPLPPTITIQLTQGYSTVIDAIDSDLAGLRWGTHTEKYTCYARRNERVAGQRTRLIPVMLHRVILARMLGRELVKGEMCDHIDGNGLNNTRSNLQLATIAENNHNARIRQDNTSNFKGVCWHKAAAKWTAQIQVNGKHKYLGLFATPEEAHEAYCKAAKELHGEFARFE
jgi:hypothetical protein